MRHASAKLLAGRDRRAGGDGIQGRPDDVREDQGRDLRGRGQPGQLAPLQP